MCACACVSIGSNRKIAYPSFNEHWSQNRANVARPYLHKGFKVVVCHVNAFGAIRPRFWITIVIQKEKGLMLF